jgi:hypothetical protein
MQDEEQQHQGDVELVLTKKTAKVCPRAHTETLAPQAARISHPGDDAVATPG